MVDPTATTDVLIAGAGPAGLALAVELGLRGIRTTIIEQHDRIGRQPRAKTTNIRSMEHMRRWGLAAAIRARSPLPPDYRRDIVFATRLFGHPICKLEHALFMSPPRDDRYAEPSQWIPQYAVEEVLRERIAALPSVSLRFGVTLQGAQQSDDAVVATIGPAAATAPQTITARYLVGADGARSATREFIGARMTGDHGFASFLGLVVHAPGLAAAHPQTQAQMYLLVNSDGLAMLGPMDRGDMWFWMALVPPGTHADAAYARRRFIQSLGRDVPFEIVTADPWLAHRLVADKYRDRRIFLIGDACHLHPPFGGYGMNMGIGDAVDLGWKIAATIQRWGGPRLLEAYEVERRPVHQRTIDEAVENLGFFGRHIEGGKLEDDTPDGAAVRAALAPEILAAKTREFRALGMVLGHIYANSPIIVSDGTTPPAFDAMTYLPTATPGARAPHAWLSPQTSLFDTFGPGFTLLVTEGGPDQADVAALSKAAARLAIPLHIVAPAHPGLAALYGARFVLIRPDQHIAWRGATIGSQAALILNSVSGRT